MKSKVYFTSDISSKGLIKIYEKLNCSLKEKVAIKLSTGELGGHYFLNPQLINNIIDMLNGTIVECCTAYRGKRFEVADHWQTIKKHGFMDIAPCDIMDEFSEIAIPTNCEGHLKGINLCGEHIKKYQSMLMLSHFKGHLMGGFGGALKNMSIGVASKNGKAWIHSAGITKDADECWKNTDDQDGFLESMAEACKAVIDHFKAENMAYINVANNLSIDCDCDANPHEPEIADIGIFASLDPVAIDKCCYDTIMALKDEKKAALVNRMLDRHAIRTVERAEELNLGTTNYELINID